MSKATPSGKSFLPVLAFVLAFVIPIAGIITGRSALNQMYRGEIPDANRGLAKAAVILGWVFTIVLALLVLFFPWLFYFLIVFLISGGWAV
jgi:uncharacterized BrkB/YihY/UPF0761 family membrane protein